MVLKTADSRVNVTLRYVGFTKSLRAGCTFCARMVLCTGLEFSSCTVLVDLSSWLWFVSFN